MSEKSGSKFRVFTQSASLAEKIRYSFLLLEIPLLILMLYFLFNLWRINTQYDAMIGAVSEATGFSMDFKKDFDYETYLVIAGNKSVGESDLQKLLSDANQVVSGLEEQTLSSQNKDKLESIKKYLTNLDTYKKRIEENLKAGDKYEDNIRIWENDVQIVTDLLQESVYDYIYHEVKSMQESQQNLRAFYYSVLKYSLTAFVLIIVLTSVLSYLLPRSITKPVRELYEVTRRVSGGDLKARSHVAGGTEIAALGDSMNAMLDRINGLMDQVTVEQTNLRKAEFELLQSQINPHFLYNTLDAIIWLAEAGQQKAVVSMVGSLSEFFRISLSKGRDIISLKEELRHVKSYLEIQQVRYQDILRYEIDLPEEILQYTIPKITIQPLAENALYHGTKNKRGGGCISITGGFEKSGIFIKVRDDGVGMNEETLRKVRKSMKKEIGPGTTGGYALYNVDGRIRLYFGAEYGLTIDSKEGEGTTAVIHLPCQVKTPDDTSKEGMLSPEKKTMIM